jgi:hypothetical protein
VVYVEVQDRHPPDACAQGMPQQALKSLHDEVLQREALPRRLLKGGVPPRRQCLTQVGKTAWSGTNAAMKLPELCAAKLLQQVKFIFEYFIAMSIQRSRAEGLQCRKAKLHCRAQGLSGCTGCPPSCLYRLTAYAPPMAMLLSRQKPWLPCGSRLDVTTPSGPAWCPGGRTAQKALRACQQRGGSLTRVP